MTGLAEVTSPPYDVIFRDKEVQLMAADPHNVVRLILPRAVPGHPGEEYRHAAESLRLWQDEGILVTDRVPALYVYEQAAGGAARGSGGSAPGANTAGGPGGSSPRAGTAGGSGGSSPRASTAAG